MFRVTSLFLLAACGGADTIADDSGSTSGDPAALNAAFDDFSDNVTTYLDGDEVVIETNGYPDHVTPYWGPDHPLYTEPSDDLDHMTPGYIERFQGSYTLRVPAAPVRADRSSATTLGAIGVARSGAMIYNDEEGPGEPIDNALGGLDYTGAHTGPQSYHYHLEPKAWSDDDDSLIGIIADGFFLYGRKCASTGEHPTDLDESGGHVSSTQFHESELYHYHIINEAYLGYYILFPGDYQGTPNQVQ